MHHTAGILPRKEEILARPSAHADPVMHVSPVFRQGRLSREMALRVSPGGVLSFCIHFQIACDLRVFLAQGLLPPLVRGLAVAAHKLSLKG